MSCLSFENMVTSTKYSSKTANIDLRALFWWRTTENKWLCFRGYDETKDREIFTCLFNSRVYYWNNEDKSGDNFIYARHSQNPSNSFTQYFLISLKRTVCIIVYDNQQRTHIDYLLLEDRIVDNCIEKILIESFVDLRFFPRSAFFISSFDWSETDTNSHLKKSSVHVLMQWITHLLLIWTNFSWRKRPRRSIKKHLRITEYMEKEYLSVVVFSRKISWAIFSAGVILLFRSMTTRH